MMTPRSSLHCKTLVVCLAPGFGCADNKDSSNHTFAGAYGFWTTPGTLQPFFAKITHFPFYFS